MYNLLSCGPTKSAVYLFPVRVRVMSALEQWLLRLQEESGEPEDTAGLDLTDYTVLLEELEFR